MKVVSFLVWLLAVLGPVLGYVALLPRSERRHGKLRVVAGTLALGAVLFVPARVIEHLLESWTGLLPRGGGAADLTGLAYLFLVVAPLEQGLKVAAITPVWRSRHFHESFDGIVYASAAALGFVTVHNAFFLWGRALGFDLVRALLALPAHLFFAAMWGYALARDPSKRLGGRPFNVAWLLAMAFNGVFDHIVFGRSKAALVAIVPVLFCMAGLSWMAARDLSHRYQRVSDVPRASRRLSIAPPSLGAMREALLRTERPVMLTWIAFGALVQTGVMTTALAGAIALGHRLGLDFAAVDRGGTAVAEATPLVLLGLAAMAAFPIAGYLVARASSTKTVLEPAMSAALAIAGFLVLLGLAAPVAVVFAIAFAPVAFGLACIGAWGALR
jgi:RsiW-degrading membrane proteinase PrsW (M82 family)